MFPQLFMKLRQRALSVCNLIYKHVCCDDVTEFDPEYASLMSPMVITAVVSVQLM